VTSSRPAWTRPFDDTIELPDGRELALRLMHARPSTYLRQVYFDTVVFTEHRLAYPIDVFGAYRIFRGSDRARQRARVIRQDVRRYMRR
jgi:hypothetical protein